MGAGRDSRSAVKFRCRARLRIDSTRIEVRGVLSAYHRWVPGAAHAAASSQLLHPGDGFGQVLLWALREVSDPNDEPLAALLETYAATLKTVNPDATFAQVLSGIQFAASMSSQLTLEEQVRLSAALEQFSPFW